MSNAELATTAQIFDALGGINAVAELTGSKYARAANWKYFGKFPPNTFLLITTELSKRGLRAPASLWGQIESAEAAE